LVAAGGYGREFLVITDADRIGIIAVVRIYITIDFKFGNRIRYLGEGFLNKEKKQKNRSIHSVYS
jgi:hypothetical protein